MRPLKTSQVSTLLLCKVQSGLMVHPDREHIVYPLGCNIIIEDITKEAKQCILSGHTNDVTCIDISNDGRYIVSGQETFMGFKAIITLWDYATKKAIQKWELHKVKVQAVAFSKSGKYVISLGGQDDGSVVVWDMVTKEPICGSPAQVESAGITTCLATSKVSDEVFVTGGDNTLRVWTIDKENRKIRPSNTNLGGFKRSITCIEMVDDQVEDMPYFFCGTTTGDILCINKSTNILQFEFPGKDKFCLGVTAISFVKMTDKGFNMLIGTGSGIVGNYNISVCFEKGNKVKTVFKHRSDAKPWKHCESAITSIAKRGAGHQFFVGTDHSQVYKFQFADYSADLIKTCHSCPVNDIIFPFGVAQLILTCQEGEIRVWDLTTGRELRRFVLANKVCNALAISRDGKIVVSGWNDGKIRILGFKSKDLSLELKHVVMDAHNKGVTAVALTTRGDQVISGGGDGMVRMWEIITFMDHTGKKEMRADLRHSMKEHKNCVSEIVIASSDKECASASGDGTTIIWDLTKGSRKTVVFANTLFKSVCYGEDEHQIITCGTDHKIGYWETYDGSMIRELEGAKAGAINFMDITSDQKAFATGGEEKLIKLWRYREGEVTHVGKGHSANISRIRIAPDNRSLISVSEDGAILQWRFPAV
ncbi:cilia- and flagella-associated protein 52 isoform X2 [Aplysia californica]|uniref:Cilia- and flagella-associated protein 52 n=1 Tax=Aplysia californica TaxID=6500 RepID=A0ABM1VNX1_APLCA|nr:cilia- and flagella-associated protein 52 isoform X2 [Aplysia californica]